MNAFDAWWAALSRALRAAFEALLSVILFPLRALGLAVGSRQPSAADVAQAAIEAAEPAPEPKPENRFAELIRAHAAQRGHRIAGIRDDRVLDPLPAFIDAWLDRMSRSQLHTCSSWPAADIQQHVWTPAGQKGRLHHQLGPVSLPDPVVAPIAPWLAQGGSDGRTDRGSGGGQKAKPVADVLAELGIDFSDFPTPAPRMR